MNGYLSIVENGDGALRLRLNAPYLLISMNGVTVDMRVDANGFLSLFETLIELTLKDAIVKGIETQWPRIQPALNAALGPALRDGLNIPGRGRVRITRLRTEENQTTLRWRTR